MWNRIKSAFYGPSGRVSWKMWRRISGIIVLFILFYYLIGMVIVENINDDRDFAADRLKTSAITSRSVDMAVALIDREVNEHAWISNDLFYKPGYMLDNMAHYQKGILSALAIFSIELKDQLGRTRGSSQTDPDLKLFASFINYKPDQWILPSSESQYRKAMNHLNSFQERVQKNEATYETRADNLLSTLDKISLDMGSSSDAIAKKIDNGIGCVLDTKADDLFYNVKGRSYTYWLLLKGLRADFDKVILDRDVGKSWDLLEKSLSGLLDLDPMIVSNCGADSFLFQNHIASQGFYLLRARTQLKEITNILLK